MDILDSLPSGSMIFGTPKMTDRSTVMVIPGFNDSAVVNMGDLGLLKGEAKALYEKLKKLEG